MERLTKRLADGTAYTGALINASIKGVTYPTYIGKAADKLADYEDANEQGLLLRLPCKVGAIVYILESNRISKVTITRYDYYKDGSIWFCFNHGYGKNIVEFGKTVFLHIEEAESKLKEMEE